MGRNDRSHRDGLRQVKGLDTMSKLSYFYTKNAMLISSFISNAIGVAVIIFITRGISELFAPEIMPLALGITRIFLPCAFIVALILTLIYERPIRFYLDQLRDRKSFTEEAGLKARKRLLNEPFFLIGLAFCIWLIAAVIYSVVFWSHGANRETIEEAFLRSIFTGLITVTIAFFVFEFVLQRRIVYYFFPDGGLSMIPGTLRIHIRTRLIALLLAINIVPLLLILDGLAKISSVGESGRQNLEQLQSLMFIQIFLFICVGIWMIFLVSSNLTQPFKEIIKVLQNTKNGDFGARVRVTSNDEIGYTGDVINEMTEGLIERDRMQQSLNLAREVQQNLLPVANPQIEGLDIVGSSVYCDETGGDYYDFIISDANEDARIGIAIGDVSGHGISSALLMAAVRSALRQRSSLPGDAANIISDVNRQLVHDVEDSGQFVTMFYLIIDPIKMSLQYVRAGHDPAIFYDPTKDAFEVLGGMGMALGVDKHWDVKAYTKPMVKKGQIIFLGTDGIWEARNLQGEMFGKEPIYDIIRNNSSLSANEILNAMMESLKSFQKGAKIEDDITLVTIKITD